MLAASFDEVAKKVMHCVFHYVPAYLILSTVALVAFGFGVDMKGDSKLLVKFISVHYAVFAVTQIGITLTSKIPKALSQMF